MPYAKAAPRDAVSEEWAALTECASPCADFARLGELLHTVSWPANFALAEEHGVIALLAAALRSFDDPIAQPEIAQALREYPLPQ